jgi:A/G-specific adenine glycosylase
MSRCDRHAMNDETGMDALARADGPGPGMTEALPRWYAAQGRHHLPWRQTRDPWAVLVSEIMLQQTSVGRVLSRWHRFLDRWPTPAECGAATLEDVLREWQGLGYPRRALALWRTAQVIAARGWPSDEAGLRDLPGVGAYTARALLCFAFERPAAPPCDVNLARVTARCFLGTERAPVRALDVAIAQDRPPGMGERDYALALFDIGATLCRRRSVTCQRCPLAPRCRSRDRLVGGVPPASRRQAAYPGSMRELRGAILRVALARPHLATADLECAVAEVAAARRPGAVAEALAGLRRDGLLP